MGPPGEGLVFMALYGPQMVTWSFGVRLYTLAILTQFCVVKPEAFVDFSLSSDGGRACTVPPGAPGFILAGAKGAAPQSGSRNMKACRRAGARAQAAGQTPGPVAGVTGKPFWPAKKPK